MQPLVGGVGTLAALQDQSQQVGTGFGVEGIAVQLVTGNLQLAGVSAHQREVCLCRR